jgi:hypothetical protein
MERLLDAAYRWLHAAYDRAWAAYKLVDILWSGVWAAVKVGGGSILGVIFAIALQARIVLGIFRCFFGPEFPTTGEQDSPFGPFIPGAPIISAFILFAVGESIIVFIIFWTLHSIFTFKLEFLLGTRDKDAEGPYSPIGDVTTDAEDPLPF